MIGKLFGGIFLIWVILFMGGLEAHSAVFFAENWDNGTPPANWPCKSLPFSCTTSSFNGWVPKSYDCTNTGGLGSGLSTTVYHSPPRSFFQIREAGQYSTCDLFKSLSQPYPTRIHLRFYIYFPSKINGQDAWVGFNRNRRNEFIHLIFTNSSVSGTAFRFNLTQYCGNWPYKCHDEGRQSMYFTIENGNTMGRNDTCDCFNFLQNLDRWICVEVMADALNKRYSLWINGQQKIDNVSTPMDQSSFERIILSGWNSFAGDYIGGYYIDDIVVADSYIGCAGPAAPENLRVVPKNP